MASSEITLQERTRPPWEALPADVLCLIFKFFPLRPRLYCVSIACKRWRAAALSMVKAAVVPKSANEEIRMLRRLQSVTELRAVRDRLPNSNSAVKILHVTVNNTVELDSTLRIPSLTALSYAGAHAQLYPVLSFLSAWSATAITRLHISLDSPTQMQPPPALQKLSAFRLPHLIDLAFAVEDFVEQHRFTQLGSHLLLAVSLAAHLAQSGQVPYTSHRFALTLTPSPYHSLCGTSSGVISLSDPVCIGTVLPLPL